MTIAVVKNKKRPAEILLVEDNRGDAVLVTRAFRASQIVTHIRAADSAEQALAYLRREGQFASAVSPDIILLDLNLPKMNGQELLSLLKADAQLRHIPVLVLSSSRAGQDVITSYGLHSNGYIVKPTDLEGFNDLVTAIEKFFFMLVTLPDAIDIERRPSFHAAG